MKLRKYIFFFPSTSLIWSVIHDLEKENEQITFYILFSHHYPIF